MDNAFSQPQTVVVLGGSSDIARAIIEQLCANRTETVVLAGRNAGLLDEAAAAARAAGATRTDTVLFDAEDPSNARRTVTESFEKAHDNVDLVIVAVGLLGSQSEDEDSAEAAARVMTVNLTWPVAALAEVRRRMVAQGSGRILVITSVSGVRVRRTMYLYGGAKAGLDRLCDGLADSLEGTGVSLQVLRAGVVRTKMTLGHPEPPFTTDATAVAIMALRGLASGERVIWSPPALRYVFGVLRHLPKALFRKITER